MERRATLGTQNQPPASADPTRMRERSDSDYSVVSLPPSPSQQLTSQANRATTPMRPPTDSPYPWAQRRLNFTANMSPFPRYGAAVNANASRWIYIMGGLVSTQTVKGDLWMVDLTNGMACYPVNTVSEGPGPRVGHASLLVGNAFIIFGGDTKLEDGDVLDETLYLLNTCEFPVRLGH
jgi:Galactose oxidase, central domain